MDIKPTDIIEWANSYASYDDLELVAKAVYGIYTQTRAQNGIPKAKKIRMVKKASSYYWRPKRDNKALTVFRQNTTKPYTEVRK